MPPRNEKIGAFERLRLATPICDDASLVKLEEEVAEYLREAKRRDASGPDELISTVLDSLARKYFRHILLKQAHVTPLRRRRATKPWKPAIFPLVAGAIGHRAVIRGPHLPPLL